MTERRPMPPGTLHLLVLKAVSVKPLHGVGIAARIEQLTGGVFQVSFGSLFPSLHQMEERGWLEASWGISENNRRAKFYRITAVGRRQLKVEEDDWRRTVGVIDLALRSV